ncbi:hypothetical protein [Chitinimonas sp.]|uniref:hypothetical protein n=1 Tax=Chitinimonas sp. TaxID=1934313 RepID=UPI0035B2938A
MLRRIALLTSLLLLASCARLQDLGAAIRRGGVANQTYAGTMDLRAPSDWGELARDAAHRVSQRASQVSELASKSIYVTEAKAPTPFALALRQFLVSDLTRMGLTVAQRREGAGLMFDFEVQSVRPASGMQVVVTTSIGNGSRYLYRNTDAYWVTQSDTALYDEALLVPPPPPKPVPPTPTKAMGVTGRP